MAIEAGRKLIPVTLELGGKSPNIVFADADRDAAEAGLLAGIFAAAGQTCVAGSRAFIHRICSPRCATALSTCRERADRRPSRGRNADGPVGDLGSVREGRARHRRSGGRTARK